MVNINEKKSLLSVFQRLSGGTSFVSVLFILLFYIGVGVIAYSYLFEDWPILDSVYFAVTTFSTVGYGDLAPSSEQSKIFTIFYILWGVIGVAFIIEDAGEKIVNAQLRAVDKVRGTKRHLERHGQTNIDHTLKYLVPLFFSLCVPVIVILGSLGSQWSLTEMIYFVVVTGTTVGYGDFSATSPGEKLFSIIFIPISVGAIGCAIGQMISMKTEGKLSNNNKNSKMITPDDIEAMDKINKGQLSRQDFIEYMLVHSHDISPEVLAVLNGKFDKLDEDDHGMVNTSTIRRLYSVTDTSGKTKIS